ncbi:hypothetical protein QSV34_12175 [Porticoccus sp. W117]|uniref:hypothetical protein n=1 Tax=Porticoccus sp. W117 TaxID=3054777 RepID=UPI00259A8296|nr:hypothetical protein [Porticoccus sp. W117]MDM3872103.1 hypothetical protein [Porticoccus sp. W117]
MSLEELKKYEDRWETSVGACIPGERVIFRGKDLFTDAYDLGWVGLLFYGISGREFSKPELEMLEAMMVISGSFPDPRIWNNRISALAGTARSTASLGFSAATAVTEAQIYGHGAVIKAFEFIEAGTKATANGANLEEFTLSWMKKARRVPGFGRPITDVDERLGPLLAVAKKLSLDGGPHLAFALSVESFLKNSRYKQGMNAAGLVCALAADMNVSMRDFYMFSWLSFLGGIFPCYTDATEKPEGSFFPLSCKKINYVGKGRRTW